MKFADTHTHLYLEEFDADRDAMIARALESGVDQLFLPNIDRSSRDAMISLVEKYPEHCFPMMGLHPTSVKENWKEELAAVEKDLSSFPGKFCAIGEIGIDLYWDKTFEEEQKKVFIRQLELALEYDLPAVIHTRNSMDIAIEIVREMKEPNLKGIFHCFSGNLRQAQEVTELGFLLGIGGVVTFKNSGLQKVVEEMDLEHIVLETDAPFLAPVPHRGQRNESAYIPLIAQRIAELKKTTLEVVAEVTTRSAGLLCHSVPRNDNS